MPTKEVMAAYSRKYSQSTKGKISRKKCALRFRHTPKGAVYRLLAAARGNAKRRGHAPPSLEREWVMQRLEAGCALTGLPFVIDGSPNHPQAPSLDRIDTTRSYTPENTRLVCWAVNMAMGAWGYDVYLRYAQAAITHQSNQHLLLGNDHVQPRKLDNHISTH